MFTSFSTALSALNANSIAVDAVGNDLANLNTTGYKTTQLAFEDLMSQSLGGINSYQVGMGTARPQTIREFRQGQMQTSGGLLDAAIQGNGFFVVKGSNGNTLYTRDGTFAKDTQGYLVDAHGQRIQGWTATGAVLDTNGPIGDIQLPNGTLSAPVATKNVSLTGNLDSRATGGTVFSQPITAYDTLGAPHTLTVTFKKDATTANQWAYSVTMAPSDFSTPPTDPVEVASGTIAFDPATGQLSTPAFDPQNASAGQISITTSTQTGLASGGNMEDITWSLYNPAGKSLLTQVAQDSGISANSSDGSAPAQLSQVSMSNGGQIMALYTNGQSVALGQVALASIINPNSMLAVGNNDFQASGTTAPIVIGTSGSGGRGDIIGGSLEQSTVDIAQEFSLLLTLQNTYQANSRVVTTANQMLQQTVSLIAP
jgi:flagellar hook protein FlgE